ncbi:MAG: NADH-quinone oxidoreductase subunit C [Thermoactinomyces sp.]
MSPSELLDQIRTHFRDTVLSHQSGKNHLFLTVASDTLTAMAGYLLHTWRARLITSVGTDKVEMTGGYEVLFLFSLDHEGIIVVLKVPVDAKSPHIPSLTPVIPGADWCEREIKDLLGIIPEGHPSPRKLVLADDWPDDVHPLRKDFPYDLKPPRVKNVKPDLPELSEGQTVMVVGPFYPTLEEPAYFRLLVEGEKVVDCHYRGFYSHRGIEKLAETVMDYNKISFLAERICGICGFVHSTGYCQAVEAAGEIEVPARARYIRTIMLELERIHSHLLWLGLAGHIVGFDTVLMQSWRVREPVMWLSEQITGNRKTYGMNLVGGVRRDIPPELYGKIKSTLGEIEAESRKIVDAIAGDTSFIKRLKHVGTLSKEDARKLCVVGPTARASGLGFDARVNYPYAAYGELGVKVPKYEAGDVWARTLVRVDELFHSIDLIRQAIYNMPSGPIMAEPKSIPPWREGVSLLEAPRGECCHYVLTGPDNRPYRWRVKAPTYSQLPAVPYMLETATVADFPIIVGSIDPCFSCTERVEVVDHCTQGVRIYSQQELLNYKISGGSAGGER